MGIRKSLLLGASIMMFVACGSHLTKEQVIDSDGFEELLIGDQFEDGSYALYDIYCFNKKNASLIHLASGGERDS